MRDINQKQNPHRDDKVIAACSIFGVMDTSAMGSPGRVSSRRLPICMTAATAWVGDLLFMDYIQNMPTSTPST